MEPEPQPAGIAFPATIDPAPAGAATAHAQPLEDEANMPRWLRPSVQAARQGRYIRD